MKNLFCRLTQATADATVTQHFGIYQNCLPCADTPTGYTVSKNQNSKKWWLLPKLAVVMLLLLFTTGIYKLSAQTPTVNYNWLQLKPSATGSAGAVFDKNNNFYTMNWVRDAFILVGKISRKTSSGIVDTTWIDFAGTGTDRPADLIANADGTALYYKSTNLASDSSFIGRISNLAGTPINEPRWKFLLKHTAPFGAFNSGAGVNNYGQLVIDKNENLYLSISNKIYKINAAGATVLSTPFSQDGLNNKYATDMVVDDNDNLYLLRKISAAETSRYLTRVNASTGVADTTWALLIDNASVEFLSNAGTVHMTMVGNALYYAFDSVVTAGTAANGFRGTYKKKIKKIDLTTGISTLVNSFTSNRNNFSYSYSVADKNGNLYLTASDTSLVKLSNTGQLTVPFLKFNKQINAVGTTNPQLLFDGTNSLYQYHYENDPDPFAIPPLTFGGYAKIKLPLSVSFNQTQPTCANSTNGGLRAIPSENCGTGFQYLWTPGGATTDTISNLAPGTYSVRVVCGTDTVNQSITLTASTVVPAPTASNQSLCSGATVADLVATPTSGNTIKWYATATGGTELPSSTPLVNATKYYAAQVTPTNCESSTRAADSVTIQATVAAKADSSYCNGSSIAVNFVGASGNTYTWTATQNGTGIAASGTGNTSFTGVNNTNAVVTDTVIVSSSFNTCTPQKDTFAISVLPTPKVDSIVNMQVCPSGTVAAINFTTPITGGTVGYKWSNSNTTIGLAASGFGNIPSFTAAATAQSSIISVTPYMLKSATDTCFGTVRTFNIAADLPAAPTTTGNLVVYTGTKTVSQLAVTPLAGGTLNYYYQATGGTALAGSTIVVDDTTYYVTQTVAGCESNPRKPIKVNRIAADSIVLCSPATVAGLTATPQAGNTAIWYDVPSSGTALANTTALALGQDTLYVEEGNSSAQLSLHSYSTNNPSSTINAFTIGQNDTIYYGVFQDSAKIFRINPDGTGATIISSGGPNESIRFMQYESDATGRYILYSTENTVKRRNLNTGVVTTIWTSPTSPAFNLRQVSRDEANNKLYVADTEFGRIKLVDLANNTAVTIDSLPYKQFGASSFPRRPFAVCYVAPNSLYIGDLTNSLVFKKNLTTGVKTDSISFNSPKEISLLPNGKLMIVGGDKIITTNQDLTGSTNLVTSISSANSAKYNSIGELVYTDYRTIKKISSIQSNRVPVTVIVNPKPIVTATIDKVVCNNSTVSAVNFSTTTIGGTVTYAWTNNKPAIGLAASGTGNIASFAGVNNGTAPDTATIIVTPTITNAGLSCVGVKDTFLIIVNPTANVNTVSDQVVCNGASVSAINFGTNNTGGTVTYAWTNNTTSIGLAASGTGNIATFAGVNNAAMPITATITVTPTFTNNGVSCAGPTKTFTITVNPTVTVNPENDQVVCNGGGSTTINFSTTATGGTTTYTWTNNKPTNGLAASGIGNIASFTAVNNGTAPDTATIIITPTFANGGTNCVGTKDTIYVVVNPTAKINAIADKAACNGSVVVATMPTSTATGGTVTYTWTNNTTSIGLAASGTGNIPSFTATNTGSTAITSTIIVTPTFTNGGVSCVGTNDTFNITVNPPPIFAATADKYVCNASTTTPVVFSTALTGGTAVYHWTNSNTAIGLAATGTGNVPSFTATNNTTAPIMGSIVVYMDYTNAGLTCTSLKDTFSYVVNPTAVVNPVNDQVLCNGAAVTALNFSTTANGGITTYAWTNDKPGIGLAATGTGNIAAFTAVNNSATPDTATIIVTPTFANGGTNCAGTKDTIYIVVNPTAVVNAVSNQTLCAGSSNTAVTFSSPVAGTTYSWTNSNPSIGLAASGTGNIPSFVAVNPSPNAINATITVTPNTPAGCVGQAITYTITVNGLSVAPTAIINPTPIVCANNAFATLSVNGGALGSGAVWKWYADSLNTVSIGSGATLSNIPVAKTTTYFVRAEGTCNNTAAASVVVQRANLVSHVRQHWSDVLLFDNSSRNYVAWQWYKNGVAVNGATLQQYSESSALAGTYYVVATDKNGEKTITCPLTITAGSFTGLKISLFPNPADKGANVKVATNFTTAELQGASLTISDVFGRVVSQLTQVSALTNIQAPTTTGMYIVTLTLQNGTKYSANLLTK